MHIQVRKNHFQLLPERAIYWQEEKTLLLSDLHIGKGMHFRKEGIAIPKTVFDADLQKLHQLLQRFQPTALIVVGDMFHSRHNNEITLFLLWRMQFPKLVIHLVRGNHDILSKEQFRELDLVMHDIMETEQFIFSHERCSEGDKFCFSGHIHPGIRLNGNGRQSIKLPCFHITNDSCTLPAFGHFTGLSMIEPRESDKVFAIFENQVAEVS